MNTVIELRKEEMLEACLVGCMRQIKNLHRPDAYGFDGHGFATHIDGALGEMAVARFLGRYWQGVADTPFSLGGDVGDGLQVRSSRHNAAGLILRQRDKDGDLFVGVQIAPPRFHLLGWLRGADGKRDEWHRRPDPNRGPCWVVPRHALQSMESLQSALGVAA